MDKDVEKLLAKLLNDSTGGMEKAVKEFLLINLGILMVAAGTHFFKNPNKFALGGVSGISLLTSAYFPRLAIGGIMMVLNVFILLLGYIFLGKNVASKSLYGSFALSGMVWLLEVLFPMTQPFTNQTFMELVYGVFLPGAGSALVFHYGATTGGTDIVAKILTKFFHIKVSMGLLITDFMIALFAGFLFGIQACLFSVLGVCLKSFVIDTFLETLQVYKIVVIVSAKSQLIKEFICHELYRGATVHKATGAFTVEEKEVITTVLNRRQALNLQIYCNQIDPGAFITISNSSKIFGNGFQRFE